MPLPGDESQLPVHYSAGEPRLEIIGDRVLVDGLRRVLSYTSERLVLQVGKRRVTLVGRIFACWIIRLWACR